MSEIQRTHPKIWEILSQVHDPEIPVLSVVDLGIVRHVAADGKAVQVQITPTFAGCPALDVMRADIVAALEEQGYTPVTVEVVNSPPWSTDWISDHGREMLKSFGLAPPVRHSGLIDVALDAPAVCPYCGSADTTLKNSFGPTLCRAIYTCNACRQPFEQFKPV